VFDLVDLDSPVTALYARSRLKVYTKIGAEVVDGYLPEETATAA